MDRWDDIVAGQSPRSPRRPSRRSRRSWSSTTTPSCSRARRARSRTSRWWRTRAAAAPRVRATPASRWPRATSWRSWTTTPGRSRTGSSGCWRRTTTPRCMAVGGVARPVWPERRPDHLPPELDWIVGCTYLGQPTERADVRNLWGCNMSVRRWVFEEIGGFDEDAGRIGLIPLGCRGDRVLHPDRPAQARQPGGLRARAPSCTTGSPRPAPSSPTSARARTPKGSRRRRWPGWSAPATRRRRRAATSRRVLTAGLRRELGRGLRGDRAGWRGAAGIVTCLGTTGFWYLRGRLGHRARVNAVAHERRGRARHEDPPARAVLPAGDRRRGTARPQPVGRAGLPRPRRPRRVPRRRQAAAARPGRHRARAAQRRGQGARRSTRRRTGRSPCRCPTRWCPGRCPGWSARSGRTSCTRTTGSSTPTCR